MNRRKFLSRISALVSGFIAAILGIPLAVYSFGPLFHRKPAGQWKAIANLDEWEGIQEIEYLVSRREAWYAEVQPRTVFAVPKGENEIVALSSVCTHLGCLVHWDEKKEQFLCPCHGGVYDPEGRVVAGPPPRPLTRLATKVEGGKLYVLEIEEQ